MSEPKKAFVRDVDAIGDAINAARAALEAIGTPRSYQQTAEEPVREARPAIGVIEGLYPQPQHMFTGFVADPDPEAPPHPITFFADSSDPRFDLSQSQGKVVFVTNADAHEDTWTEGEICAEEVPGDLWFDKHWVLTGRAQIYAFAAWSNALVQWVNEQSPGSIDNSEFAARIEAAKAAVAAMRQALNDNLRRWKR